jgi:hypothetical protein
MTSRIHELTFAPTAMWDRISESVHDLTPSRVRHEIGLCILNTFEHEDRERESEGARVCVAKLAGTARWTGGSNITAPLMAGPGNGQGSPQPSAEMARDEGEGA